MKKTLKTTALVIGMITFAITGCKKESAKLSTDENTEATNNANIEALLSQSEQDNDALEAIYNEASDDISIENDGIAADYAVEPQDVDADESSMDASVKERAKLRRKSFIFCLRKVELENDQIRKIKHAIENYRDCRASSTKRARAIYAELYHKYKGLAQEQTRLFKAGKITKDEYAAIINRIKHAFSKELRELKLKEKLHEAFKKCYRILLHDLKGVLSERQWKDFVSCYKRI